MVVRAPSLRRLLDPAFTCEDVLQCVFDLRELDAAVFLRLASHGGQRVEALAPHFERDQSVVFRSLKRLLDAGLVTRSSEYLEKGGHVFVYAARELGDIGAMVHRMAEQLVTSLDHGVARLRHRVEEARVEYERLASAGTDGPITIEDSPETSWYRSGLRPR